MIKQSTIHYLFDPPLNMVHHFSPAIDNSVLLIIQTQEGSDSIIHVDCNSNILMQHDFNDFVYTLTMPNETQAIVLEVENNCFKIFNLKTRKIITYAHQFSIDVSCQCYLDYFCDSKLLCVRQNGDHDDHKIRLSYYSYPFDLSLPSKDNLKLQYISSNDDWTPLFNTRKINNHSQYVWYESRQKNVFELRSFQIEDNQPKYQVITISMDSLSQPYNFTEMNAAIIEVWQTRPRQFCLVCATNKNQKNAVSTQTGVINNIFIWNLDTLTIRQSKFTFNPKFHDLLVDVHGTTSFSMFPSFYFQAGKSIASPVYYVDNASERIFETQQWICSHRQKYMVSQRTKNQIIEGMFQNGNVSQLAIRTITFVMREQVSVFLLLNMNIQESNGPTSWDDDLVNDMCRMLDYDQ